MRDFLKSIFTQNLGLKFLSLLLAVVVFVVVRADRDAVTSGFVAVDYDYPQSDKWILVSKPDRQLRISLRGRWSKVERFDDRKIRKVTVRVTPSPSVVVNFQPSMIKGIPRGVRVVAITPPSVELRFERLVEARVKFNAKVIGEVANGYFLDGPPGLEPETAVVRGPKAAVDKLVKKGLTLATVDVSRAERSAVKVVKVTQALPPLVRAMTTLSVRVTQKIQAREGPRALPDVAIDAVGLDDPKYRVELDQSTASVFLRGPVPVLDKLDPQKITVQVDLKRYKKSLPSVQSVSVDVGPKSVKGLPPGVKVIAVRPALIKVRFVRETSP